MWLARQTGVRAGRRLRPRDTQRQRESLFMSNYQIAVLVGSLRRDSLNRKLAASYRIWMDRYTTGVIRLTA